MHDEQVRAYIALGANLGSPAHTIELTIQSLSAMGNTSLGKVSSLYRTAPIDSTGPDYINAVAQIFTRLPAPLLLEQLQKLEQATGRERPYRNAPRVLDLDILLYGQARISSQNLTVPHPRMGQRAFVLHPLFEIAPHLVSMQALATVADQRIEKL